MEHDNNFRLTKVALALLLEMAAREPDIVARSLGPKWLSRILLTQGLNKPDVCRLVCRILCIWLDDPRRRRESDLKYILEVSTMVILIRKTSKLVLRLSILICTFREPIIIHDFQQVFAPLLDLGFFQRADPKFYGPQVTAQYVQFVNEMMDACSNVFRELLRSWPGLFCIGSTEKGARSPLT